MVSPPIREDQARKAICILKKLKFIEKDDKGFCVRRAPVLTTGYPADDSVNQVNIINFQKAMLAMAAEAYDRHRFKDMDMSTLTLSISKGTFAVMKDEIANFRKKLLSMAEKDARPDRVYQLCYHFFPMTRIG